MKASVRGAGWPLITMLLALGAFVLVGCSRSATSDLLPEDRVQEQDVGDASLDLDAQNATMQVLLSTGLTQTASAPQGEQLVEETPEPQVESGEASSTEVESAGDTEHSDEVIAADASIDDTSVSDADTGDTNESDGPVESHSEIIDVVEEEVPAVDAASDQLTDPAFNLPMTYVVKQGDWIYMIAREFNVEPREVISANPGFDPNTVLPGQELLIPAPGVSDGEMPAVAMEAAMSPAVIVAPAAAQGVPDTYVVEAGDTVFSIGLKHNVAYADLAAANDISAPYLVYPGQVLAIP